MMYAGGLEGDRHTCVALPLLVRNPFCDGTRIHGVVCTAHVAGFRDVTVDGFVTTLHGASMVHPSGCHEYGGDVVHVRYVRLW